MKIKGLIGTVFALSCALCSVHAQNNGKTLKDFDTFVKSPSLVAEQLTMTPLSHFFDDAAADTRRTPFDKKESAGVESDFYSQAMSLYIQKIYNGSDYAHHLAQDGTHIMEFLSLSNEFNLNAEAVYTGIRLFFNKLKEASHIDDTVVTALLSELPEALEFHFPLTRTRKKAPNKSPAKIIENIILSEMNDHLRQPRHTNVGFFRDLSEKIANMVAKPTNADEQQMMRERLRVMVIQFVEQLLAKIVWYPENYEEIWSKSIIACAHNIHLLGANGIINHMDDVDNLIWTLVTSFTKFLDTFGSTLPLSFYDEIKYDIDHHLVFFLETKELDEGITSKRDKLLEALTKARAKSLALTKGIITTPLTIKNKK